MKIKGNRLYNKIIAILAGIMICVSLYKSFSEEFSLMLISNIAVMILIIIDQILFIRKQK